FVRCWRESFANRGALWSPLPGIFDGAVHLAAGGHSACVVDGNRTVSCWQSLDRAPSLGRPTPIVGLANIAGLAIGRAHQCAWDRAGGASCWGDNRAGQLGD